MKMLEENSSDGEEIWKPIPIKGLRHYFVSTLGRVRSSGKPPLKGIPRLHGSPVVILRIKDENIQRCLRVDELVIRAFVRNPPGYLEVSHKDGNPENNQLSNLILEFPSPPRKITVEGQSAFRIHIRGYKLIVDCEDWEFIQMRKWIPQMQHGKLKFISHKPDGIVCPPYNTLLHNYLAKLPRYSWGHYVEFLNGNYLDLRKCNLKIVPYQERQVPRNCTSGYRGVCWSKTHKKYIAQIWVGKTHIGLGYFKDPQVAHEAYLEAVLKYHGENDNISIQQEKS